MTTAGRTLTEPLRSVTYLFGGLILTLTGITVITTVAGSGTIGGFGRGPICVTQPNQWYGGSEWSSQLGIAPRPGASLSISGTLQACTQHPSLSQRWLYSFIGWPSVLVWAAVLFLLWRLVRTASDSGPFTVPVAAGLRLLGWLIILGSLAAASAQGAATDALLNTLLRTDNGFGDSVPHLSVLPVPLLAGAALLTFARIIRRGAAMDEEIQATV